MSKTILVLTGSPRQGGNSDLMAEAFIQGAQSQGHRILRFDAGRKKVTGCVACKTCFSIGHPCSYQDDFEEFASCLRQADTLAIFTPLYWFSFPAQVKAAIDRMYSFFCSGTKLPVKESFMVICCELPDPSACDGAVTTYHKIADIMKWEDRGHIVVPGVGEPGDVLRTPAVDGMRRIGEAI